MAGTTKAAEAGGFSNSDLNGTFSFRLTSLKSFAADVVAGTPADPAGVNKAPRQDILRVGTFTAGGGVVSGHTVATTDTNAGATRVVDFNWSGVYAINSDGTGTLTVQSVTENSCTDSTTGNTVACDGTEEGAETYALVLGGNGNVDSVDLTQTDNIGGGGKIFLTGRATLQPQPQQQEGDD